MIIKNVQLNPELKDIEIGEVNVRYNGHAKNRAETKNINLPQKILVGRGTVVETYSKEGGKPFKIVTRHQYNNKFDLCLVLVPDYISGGNTVRCLTTWLNAVTDTHSTLQLTK